MTMVSVGDLAQSFALMRQNAKLKADVARQSLEVSSGRVSDVGAAVAGDFSPLSGIERSLNRLDAFKTVNSESGVFADAMQSALSVLSDQGTAFAPGLMTAAESGQPAQVNALAADARARLGSALAALNGQVGGRALFAGNATDGAAVIGADALLTALGAVVAGATSAQQVSNAVSAWFDAPSGYATQAYRGGDQPLAPLRVGDGEAVRLQVTANDPAIRDTLKGLAMAALLDRGVLAGASDQRARLAATAGKALLASQGALTGVRASLGVAQQRIEEAATRNGAETASLKSARAGILAVDPYDAVTRLKNTQNQLDTLYAITARLSKMSLLDYLR